MMTDEPIQIVGKRGASQITDYSVCIVCQEGSFEETSSLGTFGYPNLLRALEIRNDDVARRLLPEARDQDSFLKKSPKIHGSCRSRYTNRFYTTAAALPKRMRTDVSLDSSKETVTRSKRGLTVELKSQCFVCHKERSGKGDRKLLKIATHDRQMTVWRKAKELNDATILHLIQGNADQCIDMIANDFQYHKACLDSFLNKRVSSIETPSKNASSTETSSKTLFDSAFDWLCNETENKLFEGYVYSGSTLRNMLCDHLRGSMGVEFPEDVAGDLRRLYKAFQDRYVDKIKLVPRAGKSHLVCSQSVDLTKVFQKVQVLTSQLQDVECLEMDLEEHSDHAQVVLNESYHTAKYIRGKLKTMAIETKRVSASSGEGSGEGMLISHESSKECVPTELYNFMAWVVSDAEVDLDSNGRVVLGKELQERVLNLSQDVCAATCNVKSPKQVGLALHIMKSCRGKDLITLLNRFGHCISYAEAQRYITAFAAETQKQLETQGFFIPENITKGLFTQFAIDNLDFNDPTPEGNTTHGTTHIIYQYGDEATLPPGCTRVSRQTKRAKALKRTRSFEPRQSNVSLADRRRSRSVSGIRLLPQPKDSEVKALENLMDIFKFCQQGSSRLVELTTELNPISWQALNETLIAEKDAATIIGYGPFFPQSPTNPDVVMESVDYCMQVAKSLEQSHCIITCDQAIYEIALALKAKYPTKYENLIIRMGGFHIAQNFLGAIGHLMKGTGLETVLVEAEIALEGTVNKIMDGKDYYKMLRVHSLTENAIFLLLWEAFEEWMLHEGHETDELSSLSETLSSFCDAVNTFSLGNLGDVEQATSAAQGDMDKVKKRMQKFLNEYQSPTSKLWIMYLDMVGIIRRYVYAERTANWNLHLSCCEEMMPYLHAAGHSKYVACLPQYLNAMKHLPNSVEREFLNGNFVVRRKNGKYNGVWTDMALEQTFNRDAKTQLFSGISQKQSTIDKYLQALPSLTSISQQTLDMAHLVKDEVSGSWKESPMQERDAVSRIIGVVQSKINPFGRDVDSDLVNICSGQVAASTDLVEAKEIGLDALKRAEDSNSSKVDPIHLKGFTEKKKGKTASAKLKSMHEDERSVTRAMSFALSFANNLDSQEQKIECFAHEWTKYPSSLFDQDEDLPNGCCMRKGNKADFIGALKNSMGEEWIEVETLPTLTEEGNTGYIVDMMAFVQRFQTMGCSNFDELQKKYLQKIVNMRPNGCTVVHVVGDRYNVDSLKHEERCRREKETSSLKTFIPHASLPIPKWKKFIPKPENKQNLLKFLIQSWSTDTSAIPESVEVIVGGFGDSAVMLTNGTAKMVDSLSNDNHEEADTLIFAHAAFAIMEQNVKQIVVEANDTDIIVMGIYHVGRLKGLLELWIHKHTQSDTVNIPCHVISAYLEKTFPNSSNITAVVLTAYIISGCDTVSYPFRIGKRRALKVALKNPECLGPLANYMYCDLDAAVQANVIDSALKYFFGLYGSKDFAGTMNELRCHLFLNKKSDIRSLPPTENAFYYHLLRALHQLTICKNAVHVTSVLPDPQQFGRKMVDGSLVAVTMTKPCKPKDIHPTSCKCKKRCRMRCPCASAGVKCTIACSCLGHPGTCDHAG